MKHTKQILLVFPGLGKTTAAKSLPGLADCDYGYYRSSWPGRLNFDLLNSFSQKVINIYAKEGFIVLTNEPSLIPWLKQLDAQITMVLPKMGVNMGKRYIEREKEHPVNRAWALDAALKWSEWEKGWFRTATKYSIPIIYVEYVKQDWKVIEDAISNRTND